MTTLHSVNNTQVYYTLHHVHTLCWKWSIYDIKCIKKSKLFTTFILLTAEVSRNTNLKKKYVW